MDVKVPNDGCSMFDSCLVADFFRTCSCRDDCSRYGTCCLDAADFKTDFNDQLEFHCYSENTATPVFAKKSCADDFEGDAEIEAKCLAGYEDKSDLLPNLLVSSSKTSTTYWNWNCAICNHEDVNHLAKWSVHAICPLRYSGKEMDSEYIRSHITFDDKTKSWGLDFKDGFVLCNITYYQPINVVGKLSYCAPNMVSNCPADFNDEDVAKKCQYYHGERKEKLSNRYFKNVHCALCNSVDMTKLDCFGRNYRPLKMTGSTDVIKVMLNSEKWNLKETNNKYKCPDNENYNPFKSKCEKEPK